MTAATGGAADTLLLLFCPLFVLNSSLPKIENTFLGIIVSWKLCDCCQMSQPNVRDTSSGPSGQPAFARLS